MPAGLDQGSGVARVERELRLASTALRLALRVVEGETVRLRAMALTYISLFALVPALVVAFSVVQAFTGMDAISSRVHEFLIQNLAVGARSSIEPYLDRFIRNAHATSAGVVGGALLVWSAVTLFTNVDRAVNDVWGIRRRRTVTQQAVIYWVGLTLGPILLAASTTLGAYTQTVLANTGVRALVVLSGTLLNCAFFATLYQIIPNTRVKLRAALVGGIAAGVAWDVAKWGYAFVVARIFKYHAIYGSVAAVPIFLFWLFVSWTIVLFGARLAYVVQYARTLMSPAPRADSAIAREILAGRTLLLVAQAFDRGDDPPDPGDVAARLGSTPEEASEALGALRLRGIVVSLADGGLVPARPLEKITLLDVRRAVSGREARPDEPGILSEILTDLERNAADQLDAVTFRELCDRERARETGHRAPGTGAPEEVDPSAAGPARA